jgi:ADP-heptose:LPS heptosyltransferase
MSGNHDGIVFPEDEINKIAIFRALFLGDMLCIIPTVRALKKAYPKASITLIGLSWQREFARRFSQYFDHFIDFPGWPGLPEQEPDAKKIVSFLKKVREEKFDLLLQMQGNGFITNNMVTLWGARHITGLRRASQYAPDENLFPVSEDGDHEILRFLKILDALHIPDQGTDLEFPILYHERERYFEIQQLLSLTPYRYICIHPGARDPKRRWPAENFIYIANNLSEMGYKVVLTGSMAERSLLEKIQQEIAYPVVNIVEALGDVLLGELATIIQHSCFLFSNDTGVSHIASALKIPSMILFSPYSDITRWAPLNQELHQVMPYEKGKDPEYVLYSLLSQMKKRSLVYN